MKKLLLSLGTVAAVVAPVAAVVACGSDSATSKSSANAKGHLTEITLASTKDKATLSKLTQTDIVNASKKVTDIEELLGVPAGKISPIEGSTYLWNAQALTLTYKKLVANKPFGAVVTITPKDASTKAPAGTGSTAGTDTTGSQAQTPAEELSAAKQAYKDQINKYADNADKAGLLAKVDAIKTKEEVEKFAGTPEMVAIVTKALADGVNSGNAVVTGTGSSSKVTPPATVGTPVTSGYSITVHVLAVGSAPERTTVFYLKDWSLDEIAKTFESNHTTFINLFNYFLAQGATKNKMSKDEFVQKFVTATTLAEAFPSELASNKDTNTYQISKVTSGSFEVPKWAPEVQIYHA